jgi:hypothetical protein
MRTLPSPNSPEPRAPLVADCDERRECQIQFPHSTLPKHLRGTFLLSTEYRLLRELSELPPFSTKLFLQTQAGLREIEPTMWCWSDDISKICLTATGPHATEVCDSLPGLVERVLSTTTFDQDGFVVGQ